MKLLVLLLSLALGVAAQTKQATVTVMNDAEFPAGRTFTIFRAPGLCTANPPFSAIATAVTTPKYIDNTVTTGNYCFAVSATVAGAESQRSSGGQAFLAPTTPQISVTVP